jgi:outer membrane receptor for ferrienterochelin and colicin
MGKKIILFGILILSIIKTFSQSNGTIRGKVFDKNSGEALIGATVSLAGTTIATLTDFDGNFTLVASAGTYDLNVSFISYETTIFEQVKITANDITIINTALGETNHSLNEVVITAKESHKSENSLLTYRKNSSGIIDGISSEEISRFGDGNAASALKRVTGVTVEGGKYVFLRGLSGRYVVTTLNNSAFPALDPDDKNSVQMDLFPSNIIDNIVVKKTYLPDMPGDATGGLVDIVTADFPEKFTLQFSNSFSYNTQANFNKHFLTADKGPYDCLGLNGGYRSVPKEAADMIEAIDERGTEIISFHPAGGKYGYTENELNSFSSAFNTNVSPSEQLSFLNHGHKLSLGNQIHLKKDRAIGFNIALGYSHDYEYYNNGEYGLYKQETLDDDKVVTDRKGEEEHKLAGLLNLNFKINHNHKLSVRYFRNQSGVNYSRYRIGTFNYESSGTYIQERALGYIGRKVNLSQIGGKHQIRLSLPKPGSIVWSISRSTVDQDEPDARFFTNLFTNPDSENFNDMTIADFKFKTNTTPNRIYNHIYEYNHDIKFDLELPWNAIKLKIGAGYVNKLRESDQLKIELANAGSIEYEGNFNLDGNLGTFITENLITDDGTQNGLYYRTDIQNNALNSFGAYQNVFSSYARMDWKISRMIQLTSGLRYERSNMYAYNKGDSDKAGGSDYNDFLPSLNLTVKLNDMMNLRLSGSQTVSRPIFEEMAPISIYEYKDGTYSIGNPDLKRSLIRNTDLRWEYFVGRGELIAFTAFHKHITNAIESTFDPSSSNYEIIFFNSKEAQLYGFEIEAKKDLFDGFAIGGNFAYIRSVVFLEKEELVYKTFRTRPMVGQAPFVVNVYLSYTNPDIGLETNLAFNMSGKRLLLLAPGYTPYIYEMPKPELNFNIGKKIAKRWFAEVFAENLLNSASKAVQTGVSTEKYYFRHSLGMTFGISFKYSI